MFTFTRRKKNDSSNIQALNCGLQFKLVGSVFSNLSITVHIFACDIVSADIVSVFEMYRLIQTVRLLFIVCRACMESVRRCIWVCPACWTAEVWPVWSTWPWQMKRWPNCKPVPTRCGTSRRTCRMSNWTHGGDVDVSSWRIITLQTLNPTQLRPPHLQHTALCRFTGVWEFNPVRCSCRCQFVTSTEWNAALTHLSSAVLQCGTVCHLCCCVIKLLLLEQEVHVFSYSVVKGTSTGVQRQVHWKFYLKRFKLEMKQILKHYGSSWGDFTGTWCFF